MSNAWSGYLFPLGIGAFFTVAGITLFRKYARGARHRNGAQYSEYDGCIGIFAAALGLTFVLALVFASPSPWKRQAIFDHVFHTSPDRIKRFVILAGDVRFRAPNTNAVIIRDRARVEEMARMLADARDISPNHPQTKWSARVEMDTMDGIFYFNVEPTKFSGTHVNGITVDSSRGGWNLGDFRADGLGSIIEDALNGTQSKAK